MKEIVTYFKENPTVAIIAGVMLVLFLEQVLNTDHSIVDWIFPIFGVAIAYFVLTRLV